MSAERTPGAGADDDRRIAVYLPKLTDALWRFREDPNFATQGALITACGAIWGDKWAAEQLDMNPAWAVSGGAAR